MSEKENPKDLREKMRQKELKNNPMGSLNEGLNGGNAADFNGGMSWKETGVLIVLIAIGYIIYRVFF